MEKRFFMVCKLLVAAIILAFTQLSEAQTVEAILDTNIVEIGSQPTLTLKTTVKTGQKVQAPSFKKHEIMPTLEIVSELKPDTIVSINQEVTYAFNYLITSFEDSTYIIDKLPVVIDGDTAFSDPVRVSFTYLQKIDSTFYDGIDSTRQVFKTFDIRDVKETPWTFEEFWARFGNIILIILVTALVASIITYIVIRKMRNKPIIPISKPKEPADKVALRRLNQLKDKKLCQSEKTKEYYSELTEILKTYISERYGISVMESTSDETLAILAGNVGKKSEPYGYMKFIFGIADFVKFAKMQPLPDENDMSLQKAFAFVDETKKVIEENTENQQGSQKQ